MDEKLHINLFGTFRITYADEVITALDTPRLQELLGWLVLHRDAPQSRRRLSFLFWPDSTEKQAKTNLRNLLYQLREALPDADQFIHADYKTLRWNPQAPMVLDVAEFEEAMDAARQAKKDDKTDIQISKLKQAVQMYSEPLLPDCYSDWIELKREHLRQTFGTTLHELIELLEQKRNYETAIQYVERWVKYDEYNESAWRRLMELHARNNDRARAVETYRECMSVLREELDIEPAPETRQLYEQLLTSFQAPADTKRLEKDPVLDEEWSLVGRENEWETIQSCWKKALSGTTQCLLIEGDPGIGKSRLGLEFMDTIRRQGYPVAYSRCYEAAGSLSYGPIIEWLKEETVRTHLDSLDNIWLAELVRLLPELLIDHPDLAPPGPVTESLQQRQLFEAITRALTAGDKARLFFLDDLQWCDGKTLEWISYLFHTNRSEKLMLVGSCRPVEAGSNEQVQQLLEDLRRRERMESLSLKELSEQKTAELASRVADRPIDEETARRIYRETEGHPLFVVEMIREGRWLESRAENEIDPVVPIENDRSAISLPTKITQFITARFGHLSEPAGKLMGLIAAVGRECSIEILKHAGELDEPELIEGLDELIRHHILKEQHAGIYDFTHDKLREVAYSEMSEARKQFLHERIADAIETVHADTLHAFHGRLAWHYEQAGYKEKAKTFYEQATEEARQILTDLEAAGYLEQSQNLLEQFRQTEDGQKQKPGPVKSTGGSLPIKAPSLFGKIRLTKSRLKAFIGLLAILLLSIIIGNYFVTGSSSEINSIAVLPLENLSGDADQEYFVDGMTEALIAELGQVGNLKVISSTSAMHYKDTNKRLPEIARELDVDALIDGSVLRAGDRVRITLQFIDGTTDRQLWANSYMRELHDILALQENVAQAITREMKLVLSPSDQKKLDFADRSKDVYHPSPEAYDAYLKGRYYAPRYGSDLMKAVHYYREAIDIDPNFAKAHAALTEVAIISLDPDLYKQGRKAAYRAVELNPDLPESQVALALVKMIEWEWDESENAFKKAIELNPNSSMAHQWYAQLLRQTNRLDEALLEARRAEELNPLSLMVKTMVGWVLFNQHRYDEAIGVWNEVLVLEPEFGLAIYNKGLAYWMKGMGQEVIKTAQQVSTVEIPLGELTTKWLLAIGYALTGQRQSTTELLGQLEQRYGNIDPSRIASLYHVLGKNEEALDWLEKAYELHDPWLPNIMTEPLFDKLRDHPRFKQLYNRLNIPQ